MTGSLAESLGKGHSSAGWARDFLHGIGAPVTAANVAFVQAWERAESGGGGGLYNPLNSVLGEPGASNLNSAGVKNYPSYQAGLRATIATFLQPQWSGVVAGLRANDQAGAQSALNAEYATWGGGPLDLSGQPGNNVVGTGGGSASSSSKAFYGCPEGKIWDGPSFAGHRIYFTKCQGRAWLGGISMVGGALLMLVGFGFLAVSTKSGRDLTAAIGGARALAA